MKYVEILKLMYLFISLFIKNKLIKYFFLFKFMVSLVLDERNCTNIKILIQNIPNVMKVCNFHPIICNNQIPSENQHILYIINFYIFLTF